MNEPDGVEPSKERDRLPSPGGPLDPAEGCFTATLIGVFVWLVVCGALAFWIWNLS